MEDKRKQSFQDLEESNTTYNDHEIILDLYKGAQMVNNGKKKINIISFSS